MANFYDIPKEIIEQILVEVDPLDVSTLSRTSRKFFDIIYDPDNQFLWRKLYLAQPLDNPRSCVTLLGRPLGNIDWRLRLQSIIRARTFIRHKSLWGTEERLRVLKTLLDVACNVVPIPAIDGDTLSFNHVWIYTLLGNTTFLDQDGFDLQSTSEERQLRAQFHAYFGLTKEDFKDCRRVQSRSCMYAMRNYTEQNEYGPFMMDGSGRVNWEHVLAIHHVVSRHLIARPPNPESLPPIFHLSLPFCQPVIPPNVDLDVAKDWAGVEGFWRCSFCFCDHRDLLVINNFDIPNTDTLYTAMFEDPNFEEVFGSVNMQCHIVSHEPDPYHPTRPIIHFSGGSEDEPYLRGYVKLTPDGYVRWHFVSGQEGQRMWSSEGVQIGSVRSSYGVLGVWTTVTHERGDPVGPFWMRKLLYDPALDLDVVEDSM